MSGIPLRESKRAVTDRAHNAEVTDFLQRALVGGALNVTQLEARARAAGLLGKQQIQHAKAFKKAFKRQQGTSTFTNDFGCPGSLRALV
jgi:hypothetical protein